MRIGIIYKKSDFESKHWANEFYSKSPFDCYFLQSETINDKLDFVLSFGGDGTALRAVSYAIKHNVPLIAVNTGHLGFLCYDVANNLEKLIGDIKNGNISFENKTLMQAKFNKNKFLCFNDLCIQREVSERANATAVVFDLFINNNLADEYLADGIIIATPSGSTAYSLSAGGAILTPDLKGFLATAICAHSLHNRPIVFSDSANAKIIIKRSDSPCKVFADGVYVCDLLVGEEVEIVKSRKRVLIATGENYFNKLNKKLRIWGNGG